MAGMSVAKEDADKLYMISRYHGKAQFVLSQDSGNSFCKTVKKEIPKQLIWCSTGSFTPTIKRAERIETGVPTLVCHVPQGR